MRRKAVDLHLGRGHVNVRGKNRDQQERQATAGKHLKPACGDEQTDSSEQLEDAADLDAPHGEWNPRRHRGKKQIRIAQVDHTGDKKERGEKETNESAKDQEFTLAYSRENDGEMIMQVSCM